MKNNQKEYHKKYHIANRDKINARTRKHHFVYRYGITQEEAMELVKKAGNKCQICGVEFLESNPPHIDHNHKTGTIRGVLCRCCNSGLGLFNENINLLKIAIRYLK
jgi:hypothetical protein